jgi:hypothetical protein
MSLRDELSQQIRFEMSENPVIQAAMLNDGKTQVHDWTQGDAALNAYCIALQSALLKLADEVEALRSA